MNQYTAIGLFILLLTLLTACVRTEQAPMPEVVTVLSPTPQQPVSMDVPIFTPIPNLSPAAWETENSVLTPELGPKPTSTPKPEPAPILVLESASLLDDINAAMGALESIHIEGEMIVKASEDTESTLLSVTIEGDGESNGNFQLVTQVSIETKTLGETLRLETREVDGIGYGKNSLSGEWDTGKSLIPPGGETAIEVLKGRLTLEIIEVESDYLEGLQVLRITGSVPEGNGTERIVVWAGSDDQLIRQIQIEGHIPALEYGVFLPLDTTELFQKSLIKLGPFNESVKIIAPELRSTPARASETTLVPSPFGTMAVYDGPDYPFSIQYPANWTAQSGIPLMGGTVFVGKQGGQLFITEEDLAAKGFGGATLEEYANGIISAYIQSFPELQILTRETTSTNQGEPAELVSFVVQGGILEVRQLIYLHEDSLGFYATYVAPKSQHAELDSVISFSFKTFQH